MPDTTPPPPPPAPPPQALPFPTPQEQSPTSRGCLKWGLVGCAGLSIILIVALVFATTRAKPWLGSLLLKNRDRVLQSCAPDVTAEEKAAFEKAYASFTERAKEGTVKIPTISAVSTKTEEALKDGVVTKDEIHDLTAELQKP